jgi:hypothetical protein
MGGSFQVGVRRVGVLCGGGPANDETPFWASGFVDPWPGR